MEEYTIQSIINLATCATKSIHAEVRYGNQHEQEITSRIILAGLAFIEAQHQKGEDAGRKALERCLYRRAVDEYRKLSRKKRSLVTAEGDMTTDSAATITFAPGKAEARRLLEDGVQQLLQALPEEQRQFARLIMDGDTPAKAAARMGMSRGRQRWIIAKMKEKMQNLHENYSQF